MPVQSQGKGHPPQGLWLTQSGLAAQPMVRLKLLVLPLEKGSGGVPNKELGEPGLPFKAGSAAPLDEAASKTLPILQATKGRSVDVTHRLSWGTALASEGEGRAEYLCG